MFISNESESKHYLLSLLHQYIQRPRNAVLRYVTMTLIFANIHQVYINLNVSSFCIFFQRGMHEFPWFCDDFTPGPTLPYFTYIGKSSKKSIMFCKVYGMFIFIYIVW